MKKPMYIRRTLSILAAAAVLLTAAAALSCPPEQEKQADHAYAVATGFLQARNWQEAIPSLQSALAICPEHVNSLRWLGKSYMATKQYDKALEQFDLLVAAQGSKTSANDYMDQGKAHAKLKQYKEARISYIKASRIDGENCNILFNLGVMHYATKNYADAVDVFEQVADGCPELESKVMEQLAKACDKAAVRAEQKGDATSAKLYKDKFADYSRNAGGSIGYKLIVQKMRAKDWTGAVQECETFLAANPESTKKSNVLLNLARSQVQLGRVSAAAEAYEQYMEIRPSDGKVADEYIEMLAKNEMCERALAVASDAMARVTELEDRVYVHYGWGKALECAGRYSEAKEKFQFCVANGEGDIRDWARTEVGRQEQLEQRRQMQRQNAGR